jgi:hypothetical protein
MQCEKKYLYKYFHLSIHICISIIICHYSYISLKFHLLKKIEKKYSMYL